jgi:hypothetical protein
MTQIKRKNETEPKNEIIVYQSSATTRLQVLLSREMVWLNRQQMAQLFGRDVKTIGKHIANALREELSFPRLPQVSDSRGYSNSVVARSATTRPDEVVAKFATTALDGKTYQVEYYNLEMITSVGYRVKSPEGVEFRRWANAVLREYLLRGVAFNARLGLLEDQIDRRLAQHEKAIGDLRGRVEMGSNAATPSRKAASR